MAKKTQTEKDKAEKKVQIAIDKVIDLVEMGFGCNDTERILEALRRMEGKVQDSDINWRY